MKHPCPSCESTKSGPCWRGKGCSGRPDADLTGLPLVLVVLTVSLLWVLVVWFGMGDLLGG